MNSKFNLCHWQGFMDMDSCVLTVFLKEIVGDLSMDVFLIDSCSCELRHE